MPTAFKGSIAIWLLLACLSVAAMSAGVEDAGCEQAGPGEMAEAGLCPPIKVHVPYPGFSGNYGVNGMFHHGGVKWYANTDGHSDEAPWYEHTVPVSSDHPASRLILGKGEDASGTVAWRLFRQTNNTDSQVNQVVVTECDQNTEFPWLCKAWSPAIKINEMTWDEAHKDALAQVKVALRYAETVKTLAKENKSRVSKLKRAASNVKRTIKKVREIEAKAHYRGYVFGNDDGHKTAHKVAIKGVEEIATKAALKAANQTNRTHAPKHEKKKKETAGEVWKALGEEAYAHDKAQKQKIQRKKALERNNKTAYAAPANHDAAEKKQKASEKKKKAYEALREAAQAKRDEQKKEAEEAKRAEESHKTAAAAQKAENNEDAHKEKASKSKDNLKKLGKESQQATKDAEKAAPMRATLNMGGITAKQLKDPKVKAAFIRSVAKSMGVPVKDVHIEGMSETKDDSEEAKKADDKKADDKKADDKKAKEKAEDEKKAEEDQKAEEEKHAEDTKKSRHHEKKVKAYEALRLAAQKEAEVEKEEEQAKGYGHGSGSGSGKKSHKDSVEDEDEDEELLEAARLQVKLRIGGASDDLMAAKLKNVNVKLRVETSHRSGHSGVANLRKSVKEGSFAKAFKAEAHNSGVEVHPTIHVVDTDQGQKYQKKYDKQLAKQETSKAKVAARMQVTKEKGAGSAGYPIMPPHVDKAPTPVQEVLPKNTRWDKKGKKGTFTRCASAVFGGHLELLCPLGTVISKVLYADLGHPQGPWCAWNKDPECSFPNALPLVKAACEGEAACLIPTDLNVLAVKAPVSTSKSNLDMDTPSYSVEPATQLATTTASTDGVVPEVSEGEVDNAVDDAVSAALNDGPSKSRKLLQYPDSHSYHKEYQTPARCWAAKNQWGSHTGRLVVRAECSGTMLRDGLHSAPSMALGHVTIAGLPMAAFEASLAYHEAFIKAVEASMCQCDVTDAKCRNDECAGEVVIKKIAGDDTDTDIEFKIRVPPTRLAADVERVLALELHSETKAYEHKEMREKWRAKMAEEKGFMNAQEHEKMQKAMVESDEQKEKRIYAEQEQDEEKRSKEKAKKLDSAKWVEERRQKKFRKQAEDAQDEATAASERAMKMHYLHKEARAKRRAAKEILDKKSRAAAEVLSKSRQARQNFDKAQDGEQNAQANSNRASEMFIKKHAAALQKQASVQQLKASGGKLTTPAAQALVATKAARGEEMMMLATVERALDPEEAPKHPTFAQNFMAAAKLEGITSPPVGTSVEFWKAQQASAEADAAQLGVPAPPPPGEGPPDWFVVFFIILLILLCLLCLLWCYCRQRERVYNPYRSPHDIDYVDPVVYQREQLAASGLVDANGIPIQVGNRNDPIGFAPPGAVPSGVGTNTRGNRAVLSSLGRQSAAVAVQPSADPRREHQKLIIRQEMEAAMRELNAVPWYKRAAVQSRINELLKWQEKLEDENRPMYASAHDPTSGFPRGGNVTAQRELSANQYVLGMERQQTLEQHQYAQQHQQQQQYAAQPPRQY